MGRDRGKTIRLGFKGKGKERVRRNVGGRREGKGGTLHWDVVDWEVRRVGERVG